MSSSAALLQQTPSRETAGNVFRKPRRPAPGWKGAAAVWLPCVIAMLVIVVESTDTFSAGHTSGWLRPVAESVFGRFRDEVWEEVHHIGRKCGHFGGYGSVCLTFLRAWLLTLPHPNWRVWRLRAAGLAVLATALVASADEWHQTFIPSRTGTVADVGLDTLGGTVACLLVALLFQWWRQNNRAPLIAESSR